MLGNLAQLEMRDSAIDPDVADAIKESSLFTIATPTAEQLANPITFFAFPGAPSRVEQQLLDQGVMPTTFLGALVLLWDARDSFL